MVAVGLAAAACAMILVRWGWGRSRAMALAGWALAALALLVLAREEGAWGMAMGATVAIAVALVFVLLAGANDAPRARRAASVRSHAAEHPPAAQPLHLPRRLAVFLCVVPLAFAGAQALAFGAQAFVRASGGSDANAVATMLFLQPFAWACLMSWQLLCDGPSRMVLPPILAALAGLVLWSLA